MKFKNFSEHNSQKFLSFLSYKGIQQNSKNGVQIGIETLDCST